MLKTIKKIKSNTPQKIKIKNQNLIMCEDNNAGWWINGGVEDRRWLGLSSTPLDLGVTILFGLFQDLELADEGELFEFSLHGVDDADDG